VATYTSLDILDLPSLAQWYHLTDAAVSPLKGGAANSSFRVDTAAGCYVLTG
jgi:homoserine kinase type II